MALRRFARFYALVLLPLVLLVLACNSASNRPPVASAGQDRAVSVGALVELDSSESRDPDGDALSFAWVLEVQPIASNATLAGADTAAASFTADLAGGYLATLTVSDGEFESTDLVAFSASEAENVPPILSSIDPQRTEIGVAIDVAFTVADEAPETVTVTGTSSDTTLVSNSDISVLGSGSNRSLHITPAPQGSGSTVITLVATDPGGLEGQGSFTLTVDKLFEASSELLPGQAATGDAVGTSVAIDGDYAIVGAPGSGNGAGAAYLFRNGGDEWPRAAKLPPAGQVVAGFVAQAVTTGDRFGESVAISGNYAIVGAPLDDEAGTDSGSAYVYRRCTGPQSCTDPWVEIDVLNASDAAPSDEFGSSVAISGEYAVVGAPNDGGKGSAYVFQLVGEDWIQVVKIVGDGLDFSSSFGFSVAISGDTIIVGDPHEDNFDFNEGSAYVFQRNGSQWNELLPKLESETPGEADQFGGSVSISGDFAVIGEPTSGDTGAAHVFRRSNGTWEWVVEFTGDNSAPGNRFGSSVATSGDYAIVGAPAEGDSGSVYVYRRSGDSWTQKNKLTGATFGALSGHAVAISGDHAVVGAPGESPSGAAYVHSR